MNLRSLLLSVACCACGPGPQPAAGPQRPGDPLPAAAPPPAATRTCMEMVDCVAHCTPDAECPRACIASGNDASKEAARDVLECQYDQDEDSPEGECDGVIATCTALGTEPAPATP